MPESLPSLMKRVYACTLCEPALPMGANPIVVAHPKAKIALVSQAPGRAAHLKSKPYYDPSGDRLRAWLNVDHDTFYNPEHFCILPMGFCYPGKGKSGDLPPRKECAPTWHQPIWSHLSELKLILLIGSYAQKAYLPNRKKNLTETVRHYREYLPKNKFPLVHPSPLNTFWLRKNAWYEAEVIPQLQQMVSQIILKE